MQVIKALSAPDKLNAHEMSAEAGLRTVQRVLPDPMNASDAPDDALPDHAGHATCTDYRAIFTQLVNPEYEVPIVDEELAGLMNVAWPRGPKDGVQEIEGAPRRQRGGPAAAAAGAPVAAAAQADGGSTVSESDADSHWQAESASEAEPQARAARAAAGGAGGSETDSASDMA
jgi:hypothetical protein